MRSQLALVAALSCLLSFPVTAAESAAEDTEKWTGLQVFLDSRDFGPGKIDGRWGEFTRKSLARYLKTQGTDVPELNNEAPPENLELPTDQDRPAFTTYTVSEEDAGMVGSVPEKVEEQAELDALPYESVLELVAERFHADSDFLKQLNPDLDHANLKAGDELKVPNVKTPFDLLAVQKAAEKNTEPDQTKTEKKEDAAPANEDTDRIEIDSDEKMLELRRGDELIAAFPITPGSESLPAPEGEWKVDSISWMPWFRHDEKMLKEGERSDDAHNLPPGPNSPVGILWMALNKKGIGIHGTKAPDTIGRSVSHGCIRLSNWDAWTLGKRVKADTPVIIR